MGVETWVPGTNAEYDNLFHLLRESHHQDRTHRLWKNYSKEAFDNVAILSIYFNDAGIPEVCSSVTTRSCWPNSVYRIHNRVWKCHNKKTFLHKVSDSMGLIAQNQISWLKENTNCNLYFISRETNNWQDWMIDSFNKNHNIQFNKDDYRYLTCPDEGCESCWQRIIFNGDRDILNEWKRK